MNLFSRTSRPVHERIPDWGVAVFESRHAEDFTMEPRSHRFRKFLYILEGEGSLQTEDDRIPCQARTLLGVKPGLRHRLIDRSGRPMSLYALCIDEQQMPAAQAISTRFDDLHLVCSVNAARGLEGRWRRLLYDQLWDHPARPAAMTATALGLIVQIAEILDSRAKTPDGQRIDEYLGWLDRHFFEPMTIDQAAESVGLSRRRFTQIFKARTDQTWLSYLQALRIGHARRLLAETGRTITSVAFEAGFDDLSSFYRVFGKLVGESPGRFRDRVMRAKLSS